MSERIICSKDLLELFHNDLFRSSLVNLTKKIASASLLTLCSGIWSHYAKVIGQKDQGTQNYIDYYNNLTLNIVINEASTPSLRDCVNLCDFFPGNISARFYGEFKKEIFCAENCSYIFFDIPDIDSLKSIIRRKKTFGDFDDGVSRDFAFASIALTSKFISITDFDLILNSMSKSSRFTTSNPFKIDELAECKKISGITFNINEWKSFFENILDSSPCVIIYSDELKDFLKNKKTYNPESISAILKLVSAFILLQRFSRSAIKEIDGIQYFEATKKDFDYIKETIFESNSMLNSFPKNSLTILEIIQNNFVGNISFDRRKLLELTGWSAATLSDALKPLEFADILSYKREGTSHRKIYSALEILI